MKAAALDAHKSLSQVCILDREVDTCEEFRVISSRECIRDLCVALSGVEAVSIMLAQRETRR